MIEPSSTPLIVFLCTGSLVMAFAYYVLKYRRFLKEAGLDGV
jgi:hypothetical protein